MLQLGHPEAPQAYEFIAADPALENRIPQWYCDLVNTARQYERQGGALTVVPTPTGAYQWFNAALIERERMNPTDTQGLEGLIAQQDAQQDAQQYEYDEDLSTDEDDEA